MTNPRSRQRLPEIDALRGLAAVMVVLFHYTTQAPLVLPHLRTIPIAMHWGEYGVNLFFAISGFVIFMTLERTQATADFVVARFARLFPAYWAGIAFTSLAVHALGAHSLGQPARIILANLTMLQGFVYVPAVDGVYWSLTVELAFYACMWGLWRLGALDRIERILAAWLLLRLVWLGIPALPSIVAKVLLLDYIAYFAIGMAAYRVWRGRRSWREQSPLLALGLSMTAAIDGLGPAIAYGLTLAVFVALVRGRLTFLDRPLLLWLGGLSYPLYLLHQNIGYALMSATQALGVSAWLATLAALAAVLGLSCLVRDCVEQPWLHAIRAFWKGRGQPRVA